MVVGFSTTCRAVPITTKVVSSNPAQGEVLLDTTLCDKVRQLLATCQWFSPGTPVSSTNKTDRHDITDILLKVPLNTINRTRASIFNIPEREESVNSAVLLYHGW